MQQDASFGDGTNMIFFNLLPPMSPKSGSAVGFKDLPIGKSLIASASLRHSTIRYGLDVAIPYYSQAIKHFVKTKLKVMFCRRLSDSSS